MATRSRQKRVKVEEEAEAKVLEEVEAIPVDMLSSLPDSLLFHILSFLPTEKVVAMSILSKRWQHVWKYVDTIDFYGWYYRDEDYAWMVYAVMLSHKAECIKRVALCVANSGFTTEFDVRSWLSFALDHGVECLELRIGLPINPPSSLFTSKTLVKLKIGYADITSVNVLNAPLLLKLKELRLDFPKYDTGSLKRFITGCPSLESFCLITDNLCVGTWDISSPTLKRLDLRSPAPSPVSKIDKIRLTVPALEFFRVQHPLSDIIVEDKLSSLVEADISIARDSNHEFISRLFQLISNVKILRLRTIGRLTISAMHAQFPNLTKLEIMSPYFELILVRCFLEAAMNLEVITMEKRFHSQQHPHQDQVSWNEPLHVPKCLLSSLKKMVINGYEGKNELAMVNYVLRNGEVLEMMEIHCVPVYYNSLEKFRLLQEITMMNRGSKSCQISFF